MLLIFTFEEDPQGNQLVLQLREAGFDDFLRIDMGRAFLRNDLEFRFEEGLWKWEIAFREAPELKITSEVLRTVFFRRSIHHSFHRIINYPGPGDVDVSQAFHALNWLMDLNDPALYPFGKPAILGKAENKFRQLEAAAAAGLTTMPTLFATEPDTLAGYIEKHKDVVIKTIGNQTTYEIANDGNDTMNVFGVSVPESGDLLAKLKNYEHTQLYLQKAVPKVAEHRITALPDGSFVDCRIDTSKLPAGEIDYRPRIADIPHEIVDLADGLESRLKAYLEGIDIPAGCFDFAELEDGSMVFFECNPSGEWLWIEQLTGYPLTRQIADILIDHHEGK